MGSNLAAKTGLVGPFLAAKIGPPNQFWLPDMSQLAVGPVLAGWNHFWQPDIAKNGPPGTFLAAINGPGDHFWLGSILA